MYIVKQVSVSIIKNYCLCRNSVLWKCLKLCLFIDFAMSLYRT